MLVVSKPCAVSEPESPEWTIAAVVQTDPTSGPQWGDLNHVRQLPVVR
jgi:hypothetical protein